MPRKGNEPPTPCPSNAAYCRHIDHGEEPCEGCKQAHREYGAAHRPAPTRWLGPGECGTMRGYRWHRKAGEEPCQDCKDVVADQARGRYGKAQGTHPGRTLLPCGTPAAYERHLQHGEEPCDPCKEANREEKRIEAATRRIVAAMNSELAA